MAPDQRTPATIPDVAAVLLDAVTAASSFTGTPSADQAAVMRLALEPLVNRGVASVRLSPEAVRAISEAGVPFEYELDLSLLTQGAMALIAALVRTLAYSFDLEVVETVAIMRHRLAEEWGT